MPMSIGIQHFGVAELYKKIYTFLACHTLACFHIMAYTIREVMRKEAAMRKLNTPAYVYQLTDVDELIFRDEEAYISEK